MHIIINLQPLLTPLTGIGHYTRELTLALLAQPPEAGVTVEGITGRKREPLSLDHPLLQTQSGASIGASERDSPAWQLARRYLRNPLTRKLYRWMCTQRLQLTVGQQDALYWEPNYILLPWRGRSVVTVHDLSHERYPAFHPQERVRFFSQHLPESLARATRINVVSQFTADELQALHGIDPKRIDIVPPAVSSRFFVAPEGQQPQQLRHRYQLPERFLLSVGTLEPRKNLVNVLEAFAALPLKEQADSPLLLVGMQGWGEQTYSQRVQHAFQRGTIRRLGYVPSDDLPGLYALAAGFVYVSLYEGFGMPVVEAMAAGTPVLTANTTATTEVAAGAALEVSPHDVDAIREGLHRLVADSHDQRIKAGVTRAREFTWEASAERLLGSFTQALHSA
ncbi:glycosyltransferase family 4 protein [Vreelandella salicampi]|uniref:Glycosyltransferase family 4 protein n=1 Tax=Vreelandella salicampi TaxID=1449798 RepID=A0A7Z0LK68_9GAMM|nr:glycosyltransferase family 1 protein [Halomonas salicampi]NYS60349.1 glycosyltransferase family 4 protein [Halomonas salicampi]